MIKFFTNDKVERSLYGISFSVQNSSSPEALQESKPAPFTGISFFSAD